MEAARSGLETRPERAIEALAGGLGLGVREDDREGAHRADYPQHAARERLAELVAVEAHLEETWRSGCPARVVALGQPVPRGVTPVEILRAGRADRVRAALEALDSGVFV